MRLILGHFDPTSPAFSNGTREDHHLIARIEELKRGGSEVPPADLLIAKRGTLRHE